MKDFESQMDNSLADLIEIIRSLREKKVYCNKLLKLSNIIYDAFSRNNTLFLIGNGGSAAQAQHIAAEFVNRFLYERRGLPAISLTTDTSNLTSISNDYSYDKIFERQMEALGKKGDILLCLSTSGNSENLNNALRIAKDMGIYTFSFLGKDGGKARELSDDYFIIESDSTPRIQEVHILLGHILCQLVEERVVNER